MQGVNRQIILTEKPQDKLSLANFALSEAQIPSVAEGEALVRARYISLDAANRAWMQGVTYRAALSSGEVMAGGALAEVVESRDPSLAPGDIVSAETGWQEYAALPARRLSKLPRMEPLTHLLSVYGVTGLTAYLGLGEREVGERKLVLRLLGQDDLPVHALHRAPPRVAFGEGNPRRRSRQAVDLARRRADSPPMVDDDKPASNITRNALVIIAAILCGAALLWAAPI
ncbi:MAG TPA: hypothetical protein VHS81_08475, partial [Caulobacteraceae bacterium]|nr:hypothetical protein [Caulobacteraceae bacterium]